MLELHYHQIQYNIDQSKESNNAFIQRAVVHLQHFSAFTATHKDSKIFSFNMT